MPNVAIVINQTVMTGPNNLPMSPVPRRWMAKSATRIPHVSGSTRGAESWTGDFKSLDGAENRNRRRDHAVSVKQCSTDHGQECHTGDTTVGSCTGSESIGNDREQCEDSPLAVVIGTHDEDQIFDRHYKNQGPEHERQDSKQVRGDAGVLTPRGMQALFQGVERAGADVTEDDSKRAKSQGGQTGAMSSFLCYIDQVGG